jgi:6-phosphogluconolactonase
MQVHIADTREEVYQNAAAWIAGQITAAVEERGLCYIALSGGKTPEAVYQILAAAPFKDSVPWQQVHFFWGDERMVPYNDEQNNAGMAYENLLNHIDVNPGSIHRMPSESTPATAEETYDELLHRQFNESDAFSFDIVLLGMGDDGHTLSLFPGTEVIDDKLHWVRAYYVKKISQFRISLLPAIVNKARAIAFIASGNAKAMAFDAVVNGKFDPHHFPAQLICPLKGELYWFIDKDVSGTD